MPWLTFKIRKIAALTKKKKKEHQKHIQENRTAWLIPTLITASHTTTSKTPPPSPPASNGELGHGEDTVDDSAGDSEEADPRRRNDGHDRIPPWLLELTPPVELETVPASAVAGPLVSDRARRANGFLPARAERGQKNTGRPHARTHACTYWSVNSSRGRGTAQSKPSRLPTTTTTDHHHHHTVGLQCNASNGTCTHE